MLSLTNQFHDLFSENTTIFYSPLLAVIQSVVYVYFGACVYLVVVMQMMGISFLRQKELTPFQNYVFFLIIIFLTICLLSNNNLQIYWYAVQSMTPMTGLQVVMSILEVKKVLKLQ